MFDIKLIAYIQLSIFIANMQYK